MNHGRPAGAHEDSRPRPRPTIRAVITCGHFAAVARTRRSDLDTRDAHLDGGARQPRAFVDAVSHTLLDDEHVLHVQLELADDPALWQAEVDLKIAIPAGTGIGEAVVDLGDLDIPLPQHLESPIGHDSHVVWMIHRY
jgi:hypothetical protein